MNGCHVQNGSDGVWSYRRHERRCERTQRGAVEEGRAPLPAPDPMSMQSRQAFFHELARVEAEARTERQQHQKGELQRFRRMRSASERSLQSRQAHDRSKLAGSESLRHQVSAAHIQPTIQPNDRVPRYVRDLAIHLPPPLVAFRVPQLEQHQQTTVQRAASNRLERERFLRAQTAAYEDRKKGVQAQREEMEKERGTHETVSRSASTPTHPRPDHDCPGTLRACAWHVR